MAKFKVNDIVRVVNFGERDDLALEDAADSFLSDIQQDLDEDSITPNQYALMLNAFKDDYKVRLKIVSVTLDDDPVIGAFYSVEQENSAVAGIQVEIPEEFLELARAQ